jgi:hypothetical protein
MLRDGIHMIVHGSIGNDGKERSVKGSGKPLEMALSCNATVAVSYRVLSLSARDFDRWGDCYLGEGLGKVGLCLSCCLVDVA